MTEPVASKKSRLEVTDLVLHSNECCETGSDIEAMQKLFNECPELINYPDKEGNLSLRSAVLLGHTKCVKFLLEHGALVDSSTCFNWKKFSCTPLAELLTQTSHDDKIPIASLLLKHGANANAEYIVTHHFRGRPTNVKVSIVTHVIRESYSKILEMLLEHGANPNSNINPNKPISRYLPYLPIFSTVLQNDNEILKILLKNGANICESNDHEYVVRFASSFIFSTIKKSNIELAKMGLLYKSFVSLMVKDLVFSDMYQSLITGNHNLSDNDSVRLCNIIHEFGLNMSLHVNANEAPENKVIALLRSNCTSPRTLKSASRLAIFKSMDFKYVEKIYKLELPGTLYSYLKFDDI